MSELVPNGAAGRRRDAFGASGSGDTSGFGGLVAPPPVLTSSERPFGDEQADTVYDALERAFPGLEEAIERVVFDRGELTLHVRREHLLAVARTLRDDPALRFELLSSLSGADYLDDPSGRRLHSVVHLASLTYRRRIRVEVSVSAEDPVMPSLTPVWPTADWHERETYDFFGIIYEGHHALTRIMMPDDWEGYPQRKDYPLGGIPVDYKGAQVPPPEKRRSYS
ncbi:NADH-quinone oxidoreductase subunit C [Frankia sp. CNm7]|uniref:NADH-quinone oxidoreductase subunit C n=1 Tax=Frankia nepalensis TaxID=1836974 RepID=A0A937RQ92_9ACTN|nr:NADH-quinone oxidoreductase subunit C [Frankia nepalensis]MBL7496064.1 NADH-quinone oxidoreductase subunit C [Frankia nepalensis]MBL7515228.1 NADH-quinone oxidoreductase subunit C [Frankia nepalensis]MBL7517239.1 NADH-quinone oxidoreductase subunit C [Frankia nepalensis]MBL7630668.1 NADH-quinone oxidoreductase subunit C [Frankia nepalensis]